jgi:outer membrane receptor protein involved in Fe transport
VPEAPATNTGVPVTADLNTIPSMMIDRMEVITGGASAQWGSDAVAGVVNVILKNKFQGLQLNAQYGQAEVGDYKHGRLGGVAGAGFAGGRGHIVVAGEYERNPGLGDYTTRKYLSNNWQIIANTARATNNGPAFLRLPNVVSALSVSGLITGPANFPLRNSAFTDDGGKGVRPFNVGSIVSGVEQYGGEGPEPFQGIYLIPGFKRVSTYARGSYELSPNLTATAELAYAWTRGWMNGSIPRLSAVTIQKDNAFLPASVVAAMTAANITSFTMNRYATDVGNSFNVVTNKTPRAAFGLEGGLPGDWSWDAHYAISRNTYDQTISNSGVAQRYVFAEDAVVNPANRQIVCRAVLQGNAAADGCAPINLFGSGSPSAAAKAYVSQTALAHVKYDLQNATFNLRGSPFSTWAGPVSIGTGLEFRREKQVTTTNAPAQLGQFISLGNATAFSGKFTTKEIYLDTITPLARDLAWARSLDLTAAVRFADYSSIGHQTTWKLGGAYEPIDGLKVRVTESKDIRAPAIYELFGGGQLITTSVSVRGQSVNIPQNFTGGNPNLKAESSKTFTAGVVMEPRFASGLRMSVDYFDIKIKDAITNLISQNIATLCTQGSAYFCSLFTFNAAGVPTSLIAPAQNLAQVRTNGYDFAVNYNRDLSDLGWMPAKSSLALSVLGTYITHAWIDTGAIGGSRVDRAGENTEVNTGALPHLRMNFTESLTAGRATFTVQQLFVSKGKIDNTYNTAPALTINDNHVPAIVTWNVFANYNLTSKLQLFGAVDNLFDKSPPQAPYPVFPVPGVNGQYYDKVGRAYRVGITYTY